MRILLIDPPGISHSINIGLAYLGAYLISKGHSVKIIDFANNEKNWKKRLIKAFDWQPNFIGFSITTSSIYGYKKSCEIVSFCRKEYKKQCYYIAGGVGVTVDPVSFCKRCQDIFDFVVIGEGELTIVDLINNLRSVKKPEQVKGIVFWKNGNIVRTEERAFIEDLDILPFPNYEIFDTCLHLEESYPVMTSRGCPFQCIFCLNSTLSKRKWRPRSPRNVINEIEFAKERYHFKRLEILDDNFALDVKRAEEICDLLIAEELEIEYTLASGIRPASVTPRFAQKLKASGCKWVTMGVQDGNPETYVYANTGGKFEDIPQAIKILKDAGLPIMADMVIGLPYTTYKSTLKSMQFIKKLKIRSSWFLATPFKGTRLYEWVNQNGRVLAPPDCKEAFSFNEVIFETPEFRKKERLKAYYIANMDYSFPEKAPNYLPYQVIFYEGENVFTRMWNSLIIVWKYNRKRFIRHFFVVVKRVLFSLVRRIKHFDFKIK